MKKLALLLALVLLVSVISFPASADTIDYSFIEENADVYELEVEDNGNAFISMSLGKNEFEHKNLVEGYVSLIYSDIIVVDYNSSDPFPFWRLWIEYTADTFLGITGVTFRYKDVEYYFDITEDVTKEQLEKITLEEFPIVMGSSNYDFWLDLLIDMENAEDYAELETFNLVATLHGAQEDVEFVVPADALVDLYFMGEAIINMIGAEGLMSTEGTPVVANNLTQN